MAVRRMVGLRVQGGTLLEVLVSILLLSFGMLAMAGLHAASVQYGKISQFRGVATQLGYDLSDRMRANAAAAMAGGYVHTEEYSSGIAAITVPQCADKALCTSAEMASIDLAQWRKTARYALPGGSIYATQEAGQANVMNLWVLWLGPDAKDVNGTATLSAQCPEAVAGAVHGLQCLALRIVL